MHMNCLFCVCELPWSLYMGDVVPVLPCVPLCVSSFFCRTIVKKKGAQKCWSFSPAHLKLRNFIVCSQVPPQKKLFKSIKVMPKQGTSTSYHQLLSRGAVQNPCTKVLAMVWSQGKGLAARHPFCDWEIGRREACEVQHVCVLQGGRARRWPLSFQLWTEGTETSYILYLIFTLILGVKQFRSSD